MTSAIHTDTLTKDYGAGHGIFDLALDVNEGEAFGYLGPNGAGKTTTIKLLMGLSHATRGRATIFGLDADRDAVALKRRIGYVPGELPQFGAWRGSEIVAYIQGLRGDLADAEVEHVATRLDLDLGRRYREYSHGNKQKLALLLAFAPKPALLILDEPTSGLDPLHQQEFYGLVRDGHLATVGSLDELTGIRAHHVRIEFADAPPLERLRAVPGFEQVAIDGRRVTGIYRGDFDVLLGAIAGARVTTLESREPTLEEVFLGFYSK